MAEYDERNLDDLTEDPSQHRLDELRKKGTVLQSRELTAAVVLLGSMAVFYLMSKNFMTQFTDLLKEIFTKDILRTTAANNAELSNWRGYVDIFSRCGKLLALSFFPIAVSGLVLGVLTSLAQSGFNFTTDTLTPDFKRINPVSGFMRLLSLRNLVDGTKSIFKFVVISLAVYLAVKSQLSVIPSTVVMTAGQIISYTASLTTSVFGMTVLIIFAVAVFDFWIQWRRYKTQAMMTKEEAKKELKEREGDPQIKARIRTIQRDRARKRMMQAVPKADVIITNPTHFAVAVIYNQESGHAPKVIAKGADYLAQRIKEIARQNGVPMVENVALARTLYRYVKVGQLIPRSLYQAVAEVLAYVYKLKGRKRQTMNTQAMINSRAARDTSNSRAARDTFKGEGS